MSSEPCLRLPTKLAPRDCIVKSWFGSNFETCFGSIFGPALGPHDFVSNSWAPQRYLKLEPRQGFKIGTKSRPQNAIPGAPTLSEDADKVRVDMIFHQWSAQRSYSTVCSKPRTTTKERKGNLRPRICSNKDHVYVYRPNIVKT